jgi:hypothetical protein
MLPYTALLAQQQLDQLRAEAAEARLARTLHREPRPSWFSTKVRALASKISIPAEDTSFLPTLNEYPHRG